MCAWVYVHAHGAWFGTTVCLRRIRHIIPCCRRRLGGSSEKINVQKYLGINFRINDVVYYIIVWHYLLQSNAQKSSGRTTNRNDAHTTKKTTDNAKRVRICSQNHRHKSLKYSIKICWRFVFHCSHPMATCPSPYITPRTNEFFGLASLCVCEKYVCDASDIRQKTLTFAFARLPLIHWRNFSYAACAPAIHFPRGVSIGMCVFNFSCEHGFYCCLHPIHTFQSVQYLLGSCLHIISFRAISFFSYRSSLAAFLDWVGFVWFP